jgi:putative membrane protein
MEVRVKNLLATTALLAIGLAGAAAAQTGNPAGTSAATPQTGPATAAPHQPNASDRTFVQAAAVGGRSEVEAGKVAEQKGQAETVKQFGRRMVQDHGKANDRLAALAKADNLTLPAALDDEHRAMQDELGKLSGADFDRAYIQAQIADHQKAVQLLEWEIGAGQDAQLKSFASEVLPTFFQHLEMAQAIATEMGGVASNASAAPASGSSEPARNDGIRNDGVRH